MRWRFRQLFSVKIHFPNAKSSSRLAWKEIPTSFCFCVFVVVVFFFVHYWQVFMSIYLECWQPFSYLSERGSSAQVRLEANVTISNTAFTESFGCSIMLWRKIEGLFCVAFYLFYNNNFNVQCCLGQCFLWQLLWKLINKQSICALTLQSTSDLCILLQTDLIKKYDCLRRFTVARRIKDNSGNNWCKVKYLVKYLLPVLGVQLYLCWA